MSGKKQRSLAAKTARSTILSCVLFGIVALLIALTVYGAALTKQYISMADGIARQTRMAATHSADAAQLAEQTMQIYRSLTEEQRQKVGTEEYRSYFADTGTTPSRALMGLASVLLAIVFVLTVVAEPVKAALRVTP